MDLCGAKNSNTLIIDNIFNEYFLTKYFLNNKKYRKCKIKKLMQIKEIYLCAINIANNLSKFI